VGARRLLSIPTAFEWFAALTVGVWSALPLIYVVVEVLPAGGMLTGGDGPFAADQHQYLAWIAEARDHLLAGNRFAIEETARIFLHPMYTVSGGIAALGVGLVPSFLLWKPVAVMVLVAGVAAYARRFFPEPGWARRMALVAPLIMWSPVAVISPATSLGAQADIISSELFAIAALWGYSHTAIAVGLMPLFFLGLERLVAGRTARPRLLVAGVAGAGMLCSWVHPWQGEALLVVLAGLVVWDRFDRRWLTAVLPAAATAAPIAYYGMLAHFDSDWELAAGANQIGTFSPLVVGLVLLPVALLALAGIYREKTDAVQERVLRLWPLAVLAVHWLLAPSTPYHAFEGMSLPLAVLAIRGWRRLRLPRWVASATLLVLAVNAVNTDRAVLRQGVRSPEQAYVVTADERRALEYLRRVRPRGGVLTTVRLGSVVPAFTGHGSWAGHPSWVDSYRRRREFARHLFAGRLDLRDASALISGAGVRFVLADCATTAPLEPVAAAMGWRERRFGCARVYEAPVGDGT
jgi:hypothetical protein